MTVNNDSKHKTVNGDSQLWQSMLTVNNDSQKWQSTMTVNNDRTLLWKTISANKISTPGNKLQLWRSAAFKRTKLGWPDLSHFKNCLNFSKYQHSWVSSFTRLKAALFQGWCLFSGVKIFFFEEFENSIYREASVPRENDEGVYKQNSSFSAS